MIRLIDERIMEKLRDDPVNVDYSELVRLVGEWKEEESSMAKCPYCIEEIQKQATKCRSCHSEIEWFKYNNRYGSCKLGEGDSAKTLLNEAKAAHQKLKMERTHGRPTEYFDAAKVVCRKCNARVFSLNELKAKYPNELKRIKEQIDEGVYFVCNDCGEAWDRFMRFIGIGVIIFFLITLFLLASKS